MDPYLDEQLLFPRDEPLIDYLSVLKIFMFEQCYIDITGFIYIFIHIYVTIVIGYKFEKGEGRAYGRKEV